ncbi:hypothetical protein D9619_011222 [Psilocybe cf. subviscida]|uniref:Hydrophobic surface binding protein n=1 Tax=Psilocybe cf. subviscida TaxID=2480587 RepID=A0A8H5BJ77_9AGAR|nr:hypothetical protein D9619_011222 [Psilocybe cf. subviscida]
MVQLSAFFITLLTAASLAATCTASIVRRTVAQVEADIATIGKQLNSLDASIKAFPTSGGTLPQALSVHTDAVAVVGALKTATTDINANDVFNTPNAQTILTSITNLLPTIKDALDGVVAKKPAFAALPVGNIPPLILLDLKSLQGNTSDFCTALDSRVPASVQPSVINLRDDILKEFAPAVAAYS